MFTDAKPLGKVKRFDFEKGAEKWGGLSISTEEELDASLPWIKESYERINKAINNNEPNGWYAKVEEAE